MDEMTRLLLEEFIPRPEKVMAEKLRRQKDSEALRGATDKAHSLDLTNFAAGVSRNPELAKAMGVLTKSNKDRYSPVQMGQQGFMLPESGDFTESPMYTEQKQADRQAKLAQALQAQEAANERLAALNASREAIAAQMAQARVLAASIAASNRTSAADREADKKARQLDTDVQKLSAAMEKSGLPEVVAGMETVGSILNKYEKGKLPGYGRLAGLVPDALADNETQGVRSEMQGLANIILKSRSGAAVTEPEQRRFLREIGAGKGMSEEALRTGWASVFRSLEAKKGNILAGASPDVLQEYNTRYGTSLGHGGGVPKPTTAPGGKKKPIAEMSDEELAAYEASLRGGK